MSTVIDRKLGYSQINPIPYKDSQSIQNLRTSATPQPNAQLTDPSASRLGVREILQPTQKSDPFAVQNPGSNGQNPFNEIYPKSQGQSNRHEQGITYTAWGDMVKDQALIARKDLENQKIEDKMRKQRYR